MKPLHRMGWLALASVIMILDQLSKIEILQRFSLGETLTVTPFFDLVLLFNTGAAFSFLADMGGWQRWLFIALAMLISFFLSMQLSRHPGERLLPAAYSLIIGGALGNVIDRLVYGAVVDFLYFHIGSYGWPAFNIADSAICIGVGLMVWAQIREHHRQAAAPSES